MYNILCIINNIYYCIHDIVMVTCRVYYHCIYGINVTVYNNIYALVQTETKAGRDAIFSLFFFVQYPLTLYYYNILDGGSRGVAVLVVARNRHHDDGVLDAMYIIYIYCYLLSQSARRSRTAARLCSYIYILFINRYIQIVRLRERGSARKRWKDITLYNCSADIPLLHRIALTCIDTFPVKLSRVKGAAPADSAHI